MHNDITLEQVEKGQEVFFYLKPSDKSPHMICRVIETGEDERGRAWVSLTGVPEWMPLYHVKLIPAPSVPEEVKHLYYDGRGLPGDHIIEAVKGIDY